MDGYHAARQAWQAKLEAAQRAQQSGSVTGTGFSGSQGSATGAYAAARQSLEAQINATTESDPLIKETLISEVSTLLRAVGPELAARNYPRHANAAYRADPIWFGSPMSEEVAWTREVGVGHRTLGYARLPDSSKRVGIMIDKETNEPIIIWTPNVTHYAYGKADLEELNPPQLVALKEILKQMKENPKEQKWQVAPMKGLSD